jgi:hypothetical protein
MWFALIKGKNPKDGVTIDCAERPEELNYSKLHKCSTWSVWVFWDDDTKFKVADVDWSGGAGYCFYNEFGKERCFIDQHDHIIPMISGAIFYNNLFSRYMGPTVAKMISVFPVEI